MGPEFKKEWVFYAEEIGLVPNIIIQSFANERLNHSRLNFSDKKREKIISFPHLFSLFVTKIQATVTEHTYV